MGLADKLLVSRGILGFVGEWIITGEVSPHQKNPQPHMWAVAILFPTLTLFLPLRGTEQGRTKLSEADLCYPLLRSHHPGFTLKGPHKVGLESGSVDW